MEPKRRRSGNRPAAGPPPALTQSVACGAGAALLVNAGLLSPWLARAVWRGGLLVVAAAAGARWLSRLAAWGAAAEGRLPTGVGGAGGAGTAPATTPALRSLKWAGGRTGGGTRAAGALVALAVALWGAGNGFLLPGRRVVPVLTYHRVARRLRPGYPVPTTPPEEFAWQVKWLAARGYRTVTPDRLWREDGSLPAKPLLLTFDDGWRDNLAAARVLRRHGFRAAIFVVTGELGRPLKLSPDDLRALDRDGFLVGSHTVTHPYLDRLSEAERWREIYESRRSLESLLGHRVEFFASPYGSADLAPGLTDQLRRAGYRFAFASHNFGLNTLPPRRWAVRRLLVPSHPLLARLEFLLLLW